MTTHEDSNIFTGTTVPEAVEAGLKALGLEDYEAGIEVLDEGSRGLFGIGSKEARVRVFPLEASRSTAPFPAAAAGPEAAEETLADEVAAPAAAKPGPEPGEDSGENEIAQITRETVEDLLEKMGVAANVSSELVPPDSRSSRAAVSVDITGDDLSILIGRKAETLEALEYITRLIVGKEISSSVIINLDVQGYRKRKEKRLRRIARTVARQAVETGRRQYLEPMSAKERRIVHIELRDHPEVYTESIGEGSRRKVTINPKQD